jgi:hypothetical protein
MTNVIITTETQSTWRLHREIANQGTTVYKTRALVFIGTMQLFAVHYADVVCARVANSEERSLTMSGLNCRADYFSVRS